MAFCIYCGQSMSNGANFCAQCGRSQGQIPAAPEFAVPASLTTGIQEFTGGMFSPNAQNPSFQAFAQKMRRRGWIAGLVLAVLALAAVLIFARGDSLGMALLTYSVVVAFTCLLTLWSNFKSRKTWDGHLEDKKIVIKREHDNNDDNFSTTRYKHIPTLYFRTVSGKKVKMELSSRQGVFDHYEPGCFVRKHDGFTYPEKRDKGPEIICVYCGRIFDRRLQACPKCKLIALQ